MSIRRRAPASKVIVSALGGAPLLVLVLVSACHKTEPCKAGTASVRISCVSSLQFASTVLRMTDRTTLASKALSVPVTCPGTTVGEIDVSTQEAGHPLTFSFEGRGDDQRSFEDHRDVTWTGACQEIALQADRLVPLDAGLSDAEAGAADMASPPGGGSDASDDHQALCSVAAPFTEMQPIPMFASDPGAPAVHDVFGWRWSPDELQVSALRVIQDGDKNFLTSEIWLGTRDRRDDLPGHWIRPIPLSLEPLQFSPMTTADGLTLYFEAARRSISTIYRAARMRKEDSFSGPLLVVTGGSPYVLSSGKVLYYDAAGPDGDLDLFEAHLEDGVARNQRRLELSRSGVTEANPVVTEDELVIYFTSDRSPSTDNDLWIATRETTEQDFGIPALVPELRTDGDDGAMWISPDRCRLYLPRGVAVRRPGIGR